MQRWRAGAPPPVVEEVAAIAQRLAVLLGAGVPPPSAWGYVADGSRNPVVLAAARAAKLGGDVGGAMIDAVSGGEAASAWTALAAAWRVASQVGAPLAGTLRSLAASLRAVGRLQRELRVALAGPRATARMVGFLPAVAVIFGAVLGFDTLHALFATTPGLVCLIAGVGIMVLGHRWSSRLVRRAGEQPAMPGLELELAAVALSGGVSLERAVAIGEAAMPAPPTVRARISGVLGLASRAGVPAAELLRAEAEQMRLEAQSAGQERAARLGVTLMIPLGVCVLPAFLLLGVAPLIIALISSTGLGFT
ncbi:type II secretion system F family protein [Rathayibacter sp. YIM 133350]|uniref:type II secretion system F family protein n=1 Tax=Rathayibacter sp. YIM 133350 TaxID=3131992 RepID=UPI00307D892F